MTARGGGSCLDTASFIDARRDGIHVFDHSGRVPGGAGHWQRDWIGARAQPDRSAHVAGVVSTAVVSHDCLGGLCLGEIAAVLANRCLALAEPLVWISTRFAPHWLGDFAGGLFVGASFPLAVAAAAKPGDDPGKLVGGIYAANTIGAILGALASSLWLVGEVGTRQVERYMIACCIAAAVLMLAPTVVRMWLYPTQLSRGPKFRSLAFVQRSTFTVAVAAGLAAAGWLMASVPQIPWELVAYGRSLTDPQNNLQFENNGQIHGTNARLLYLGEGRNSSVAVTELGNGWRNFHVSGKVEASTEPQDMRLQRMLGHIPAMLHGKPESVLIVGCGAGVTAGSFIVYPDVKRIVICEIEPLIPAKWRRFSPSRITMW